MNKYTLDETNMDIHLAEVQLSNKISLDIEFSVENPGKKTMRIFSSDLLSQIPQFEFSLNKISIISYGEIQLTENGMIVNFVYELIDKQDKITYTPLFLGNYSFFDKEWKFSNIK